MIERDGRQDRGERFVDDVCRVEPAAEAGFEQNDIGGIFGEGEERGGRCDLEKCDGLAGVCGLCAAQNIREVHFTDRAGAARPGKHDPLVKPAQVRRDEGMRAVARGFQHALKKSDNRSLPIRPGHVNDGRNLAMRISERSQQALDAPEGQVDALRVKGFKPRKQAFSFQGLQGSFRS